MFVVKLDRFFCSVSFIVKLVVVRIVRKEVSFIFIRLVVENIISIFREIFVSEVRKGIRFLFRLVFFIVSVRFFVIWLISLKLI